MTLREIIAAFMQVEEGLSVSSPSAVKIRRVYPYLPPMARSLNTPCVMHQFRRLTSRRIIGSRSSDFAVLVKILAAPVGEDLDRWSEIVAAFDEALVNEFDHNVHLNSIDSFQRITEESHDWQPGIIEWSGVAYVASQQEYKVTAHTAVDFE